MSQQVPRKWRSNGIAQWLRRRNVPAKGLDGVVVVGRGLALRVTGGRGNLPKNLTIGQTIDVTAEKYPKMIAGLVRVTDGDPGRCLVMFRMDDAVTLLRPYLDEEYGSR